MYSYFENIVKKFVKRVYGFIQNLRKVMLHKTNFAACEPCKKPY